jgi:hypothetical protein
VQARREERQQMRGGQQRQALRHRRGGDGGAEAPQPLGLGAVADSSFPTTQAFSASARALMRAARSGPRRAEEVRVPQIAVMAGAKEPPSPAMRR